jgi:hypothetical protein
MMIEQNTKRHQSRSFGLAACALFFCFPLALRAVDRIAAKSSLTALHVLPTEAKLWGANSTQQFMVLAECADGIQRDVTSQSKLSLSATDLGAMDAHGKFTARTSGNGTITAAFSGRQASAAVQIEDADKPVPFTFARDIGSVLTKRGCNDTICHGGVKGRAGFRLSVYGLAPKDDYRFIVQGGTYRVLSPDEEPRKPRIERGDPEKSLVLLKPTFTVPHQGGVRFEVGSPDYQKLLEWIRSGAPYGEEAEKQGVHITRVEVFPKEVVLGKAANHQLVVTGYLANGHSEDLTDHVRFVSEDPDIADVTDEGLLEAKKPGETTILIRASGGFSLHTTVGVIEKPIVNYPKIETRNYIDQFVQAKLRKFQIVPSPVASDEEFLRRICLDLAGTLPPPERIRQFLADKDPRKRDRLIETLLNSPEYVDYWTFRLGDLLRATFATSNDARSVKAYEDWITNSLISNKPYDQMARERIAAQGFSAPARNYYYVAELTTPEQLMPELIRLFMGRRIECAQCHAHPNESWTQDQFWGLAAFIAGYTELKDDTVIIDAMGGGHVDQPREVVVLHPRTKEKIVPAFLDGTRLPQDQWLDPRMHLAEWITSHPFFAEAAVNRMWSYFFGRGIVEPVDDFRSTNPPTHPELLKPLAQDFRDHHFDLKYLMRTIVQSRTYQTSGSPTPDNRGDKVNYAHAFPRPLEAAVLLDAISSAAGVREQFRYHHSIGGGVAPVSARAQNMIPDVCPSQFMDAFGRSTRKTLPVGAPQPNLIEALHMMAGTTYNQKLVQDGSRLDRMLREGASNEKIIEEFCLAALTRRPSAEEKKDLLAVLARRPERRKETLQSLAWAILTSREFAYNH